jgi:hypothetical protein
VETVGQKKREKKECADWVYIRHRLPARRGAPVIPRERAEREIVCRDQVVPCVKVSSVRGYTSKRGHVSPNSWPSEAASSR